MDWARLAGDDAAAHPLYPLFYPRSVAVVGASPKGGYGPRVIGALTEFGVDGPIYPVNPNYDTIAGLPAYPELGALPAPVDAVAIAVPSRAVPGVVRQAIAAGAAVIARVSRLLVELPEIRELDLNLVLVGAEGDGCVAVDGLAVV